MTFRDVVEARDITYWLNRRVPCLGGHFGASVSLVGGSRVFCRCWQAGKRVWSGLEWWMQRRRVALYYSQLAEDIQLVEW